MSNQFGNNPQPSSDQPEAEKQPGKPDKTSSDALSISDLMSLNTGMPSGSNMVRGDRFTFGSTELSFQADSDTKFDGRRTTDISRLLSDKSFSRDLSQPSPLVPRSKEFTWSTTQMLDANANIGLSIPLGLRQHFQLKGVDANAIDEQKRLEELKNRINEILKPVNDESILTETAKKSLEELKQAIRLSETVPDIVSNSLHLARLYLELSYIEDARKAIGLAASVDPKSQLANQLMQELERVHPQDIAFQPISQPMSELSKAGLAKRIINLAKGRVIVVGDLLIDELLEGKPTRISREAPVLILEHADTELIPGGAANTAHNITALGGTCHAIGVCGQDDYSDKLGQMLEKHNISHDLVCDPTRPTTVKTRILSKSHSLMQQLLRIDRISHNKIDETTAAKLAAKIEEAAGGFHAIILSDYKAGVIVDTVVEACRRVASQRNIMLIVDAQNDFQRFNGCTLITPNQPDSEEAVGFKIDSQQALEKAGADLLSKSKAEAVLLTRGSHGMALFRRHEGMVELPPFNLSEVFDVTGAGDTVVATMALALVSGASFLEAMALGNLAAGIVVRKVGTAVTSQKEMLDGLDAISLFK